MSAILSECRTIIEMVRYQCFPWRTLAVGVVTFGCGILSFGYMLLISSGLLSGAEPPQWMAILTGISLPGGFIIIQWALHDYAESKSVLRDKKILEKAAQYPMMISRIEEAVPDHLRFYFYDYLSKAITFREQGYDFMIKYRAEEKHWDENAYQTSDSYEYDGKYNSDGQDPYYGQPIPGTERWVADWVIDVHECFEIERGKKLTA